MEDDTQMQIQRDSIYAHLLMLSSVLPNGNDQRNEYQNCENIILNLFADVDPTLRKRKKPIIQLEIFGQQFNALLDSGATWTMGSKMLYELCKDKKIPMQKCDEQFLMSNGHCIEGERFIAYIPIIAGGRKLIQRFILFPNCETQYLIGLDFLEDNDILVDFGGKCWNFRDDPNCHISLVEKDVKNDSQTTN